MLETVENADGNDRTVRERINVNEDGDAMRSYTNSTEVVLEVDQYALKYEVVYGLGGFEALDTLHVLGDEYTLTEVNSDELRLGSQEEHRSLAAGDEVEHGPWSFNIIDVDREADEVRLDVYEDGTFDSSSTLGSGGDSQTNATFGDDDEFRIQVEDIWFGDALDQVHIDTVYTDTIVEDGDPSPFDAEWEANFETDNGAVTELSLSNLVEYEHDHDDEEENVAEAITSGESIAGPADYFHVYDFGLTDTGTEDVELGDEHEVSFTDAAGLEHSLALNEWRQSTDVTSDESNAYDIEEDEGWFIVANQDGDHVPILFEWDDDDLILEYQGVEVDVKRDDIEDGGETVDDYGFNINLEADGTGSEDVYVDNGEDEVHTLYGGELTYDSAAGASSDGVATFEESDNDTEADFEIEVEWNDDDEIEDVRYNAGTLFAPDNGASLDAEDDPEYTAFGSIVEFADDDEATIAHPAEQLEHQYGVGDSDTTQEDSDETYEAVAEQSDLPDMALLDEEETESIRSNNYLILVSGPAVNTMTAELENEGDLDLDDVGEGEAVLEVVEDAFSSGQHALVVAGYAADDTRNAAQYIAQHRTYADTLEEHDQRLVLTEAEYPTEQ